MMSLNNKPGAVNTKNEFHMNTFFEMPNPKTTCRMNNHIELNMFRKIAIILVLIFAGFMPSFAQDTLRVTGKVMNSAGQPLANISVAVEGSFDLPAVTDTAGQFSLVVKSGDSWLNISPEGNFKKKRVFINKRSELVIYLNTLNLQTGDDMITVLAQDFLKRDVVATFTSVNSSEIVKSPVITANQFFQGRVAGLHTTNRSGDPGSGAVSFLRGVNSISTVSSPLYIVDGIPVISPDIFGSNLDGFEYNPLLGVNPIDISKATVIKDPLITAAFGSKASGGLVLIETLDPSATQTLVELDFRTGLSMAPENQIPVLDAQQHKTLINESLFSSGKAEELIEFEYPSLFLEPDDDGYINYQHNTDWQDLVFSNAVFNNLNIKVKGGDEIARYGLSFGYNNSKGVVESTGYEGYNLRFVSLLNIFTWLKMNATVSLSYNNTNLKESARVWETSPILSAIGKSPMLNPYKYDDEGQELSILMNVDELGVSNPLAITQGFEASNNNFNFLSTLGFTAQLKKNLLLNTNLGITYNVLKEQIFMPSKGMEKYYDKEAINVSKGSNNTLKSFYNNTYLKYNKNFGINHTFSSVTGMNLMSNKFEYDWGLTKNAHANDEYRLLQDGQENLREIGGANREWNWISFYENVSYSFKDKYMAMASFSLDGSSRVGDNAANTVKIGSVPFGLFYSVGGAWRISNENFLKNKSKIEELKLRVSYGVAGNDNIGEATATDFYNAIKFRETSGLVAGVLPNDELTYERVAQLNTGVDLSLWGNRFQTSVDVYQSTISDLLILAPMEAYFGFNYRPENGGKMQNQGIDLSMLVRVFDNSNFKWDLQVSYSNVKNEILEIKGDKLVIPVQGAELVNMVGEQANSFYGYIYEGVYATSAEASAAGIRNNRLFPYQAGDAKFSDISGPNGTPDGIINNYDKVVIGSSNPEHFGGVNNTFSYKRWTLSAFVQFVSGNEVFNYVRSQTEGMKGIQNQTTKVLERWVYDGQITEVPRALYNDVMGNADFSTRWIEDGTYVRLKNLSLSYTVPDDFLVFKNAQFYISGTNLLTGSKYLGYDPEFAFNSSHILQGIDYGLTPQVKQFMIGIKLGL